LAEYASNLHDGKPCPLCGSLEHPEIFNEAEAAKSLQNMRKLKDSMKQKVQWVSQLLQKISKNQIESQALQKKDADLKSKLALVQTQNKEHQQQFRWEKYPKIEILNEALSNMEAQEKKITATENQLEINAKEIEAELLKLHHYQQKLEELKHQSTDINSKYTTLKSQLSVIPYNQWSIKTSEFIEEEILRIRQNVVQMDAEYKVQQAQLDSLNKANESLNSKIALRTMDMQKEQQFIETKKSEFESLVHQSQFTGLAYILSVLAQPTDSANGKQRIESYNQQMAILQEQLKATRSEKGEKTYDAEAHKAFELEFEQLNETYATQNKLFINAESELVKLQNDLLKQQLLIKDREQLELRSADLKTLKQLFQGSKFVNYISTVHLQNLCKDANNRFFKLSGQKLSLEITEDNNFQVRDFMNDGKVRHVKTLSGGQTFQAALSLALALADSVQKNSASAENFFFLDEGFGSLDNESLQIVFDTLKTLRNENRIVGIISHVEELQQEIDTHIRVSNSENSGSFITPNY
jgi:exonuclease SbcC